MPKISVLIPVDYNNERSIFEEQYRYFSNLTNCNINMILSINNFDIKHHVNSAKNNSHIIYNKFSSSKAENLYAALSHNACTDWVYIFDFNERPLQNIIRMPDATSNVTQGPKIFLPMRRHVLSQLCFLESVWKYLILLPTILKFYSFPMLVLGSNFICSRSDASMMFKDNSFISEDIYGALLLMSKKRTITYDESRLLFEIAPADMFGWVTQRLKWAMGLAEISHFIWVNTIRKKLPISIISYIVFSTSLQLLIILITIALLTIFSAAGFLVFAAFVWYFTKIVQAGYVFLFIKQLTRPLSVNVERPSGWLLAIYPAYEASGALLKAIGVIGYLVGFRMRRSTSRLA